MNTSHSENAAEQHATTFSAGASPDVGRDETPQTTTRHKRGGRRVVRGAGAAGAAVKLHVEDRPSIFEEPRLHQSDVQSDDRSDADASHGSGEADAPASHASRSPRGGRKSNGSTGRTVRGRRRAAGTRDAAESDDATNVADDASTGESETSAESTANAKDEGASFTGRGRRGRSSEGRSSSRRRSTEQDSASDRGDRGSAHAGRPMASLLFQEPVLPVNAPDDDEEPTSSRSRSRSDDDHTDDDEREGESTRGSRRGRTRRGRSTDDRDDRRGRRAEHEDDSSRSSSDDEGFEEPDERPTRVRRRRTVRHDEPEHDRERDEREDRDGDDESSSSGRGSRSRRLNAQERMAAGEVERIEEDLEYDAITYAPIDDEESQDHTTGRRRRRSRAERDEEGEERRESSSRREESQDHETSSRRHRHEDEDSGTLTRRRRRRRSQHGLEDQEEERGSRRSRKQQYIDEITDVEGSTRLEAKKQRRRDNRRERGRQNQLFEQDFLARRENVERLMVVRERGHHTQISVIEDNVLVEHYVSDIQEVATVGNIYLGRVQNVLPSMEAAFVDIGQPRNGVLYAGEVNWDSTRLDGQPRRIELAFRSGDPVLVQVTKDPIGHKGARLTSQVTLAGRFLVLVPSGGMTGASRKLSDHERSRLKSIVSKISPKNMGVIIRTAAEGASEEALTKDLENLTHQWETIVAKREEYRHGKRPKLLQGEPDVAIRVVRDIFNDDFSKLVVEGGTVYDRIEQYLDTMAPDLRDKLERWDPGEHNGKDVFDKWQIDSQLRKGMERQVYLPSGGSIVIDRTEAMSTVDVNTGRFIGRGKSLEETVTRCNLEAAEEIARQLRLRDIGGMVMIDFVDMVMPANRDLVLRRLVECLARDRTKHQVAEVTSLGLVQMTRKRIGQGLVEAFSEECPTCKGRGFLVHDEPTISSDYDDPYAMRGGDPFVKTNKHGHGTVEVSAPKGSSTEVKAKLAQIAAAAVSSTDTDE